MSVLCLPFGPRASVGVRKVVQTPTLIVILGNDLTYRQVFLDGRPLPSDANPNWMGYSVGHWDGDTLVIESAGFNDRTWLDDAGHPHSESLHVTERLRRPDFGHLEIDKTLDDPRRSLSPCPSPSSWKSTPTRRSSNMFAPKTSAIVSTWSARLQTKPRMR